VNRLFDHRTTAHTSARRASRTMSSPVRRSDFVGDVIRRIDTST